MLARASPKGTDLPSTSKIFWEPVSAYWRGFLLADGCVTMHGGRPNLHLSLAKADEDHLRLFLSDIGSNAPIRSNKKKTMRGKVCEQLASRTPLTHAEAAHLANYGMVPRKTHILDLSVLERLPEDLIRDSIRGYMDGDGWVSIPGDGVRGHMVIGVAASLRSITFVSEYLKRTLSVESSVCRSKPGKELWMCRWSGTRGALVCAYLYREADRFLGRKRDKAEEIVLSWNRSRRGPPIGRPRLV